MVKYCWIYLLLLIILHFDITKESSDCSGEKQSGKECRKLLDDDEGSYCCLFKIENNGQSTKICSEVDEDDYKDLQTYTNTLKNVAGYSQLEIDCNSYYLQFGLLSLILILI